MSTIIFNFSTPLSPDCRRLIEHALGPVEERHFYRELDLNQALYPQVEALVDSATIEADYLIVPDLPAAAYLIRDFFPATPIIWFKQDGSWGGIEEPRPILDLDGYGHPEEIRKLFDWKKITQVWVTAKQFGWQSKRIGRSWVYLMEDVYRYAQAKERTRLQKELSGFSGRELIFADTYDMTCPTCGGFAVLKKPTLDEMPMYGTDPSWPWKCVNGHSNGGEIDQTEPKPPSNE